MTALGKLRSLSAYDCFVLLWASIMLPLVGLRLRMQGFRKVLSWSTGDSDVSSSAGEPSLDRCLQLGRIVNFVAKRGFYRANCLCRSLVLLKAMRRENQPGVLRIGVPKNQNLQELSILDAHAWIESQGTVLNDNNDVADNHAVFDFQ